MSQNEIVRVLKRYKKPKTAKAIAKRLGISTSAVEHALHRLRNQGAVQYSKEIVLPINRSQYVYFMVGEK